MIDRQTRDVFVAREAALRSWLNSKKRNSYRDAELPTRLAPTLTNEERADVELFDWLDNPPTRYFAYAQSNARGLTSNNITNWTGQTIARVTWEGYAYRSSFGDRRVNFRCTGTNGKFYAGTAFIDAGDYVRLRAVKRLNHAPR